MPWLRKAAILLWLFVLAAPSASAAVDFTLPDLDGMPHRLSDYRDRWVVVNFWATWCGPCITEIPELIAVHNKGISENITVVGINFESLSIPMVKEFIKAHPIPYIVLRIGSQPLIPFEPLKGIPSTFIVSPAGEIKRRYTGPVSMHDLLDYIRSQNPKSANP